MFALTDDSQLRTILQCIVVRGYFLSEKQPNMAGCFEGEPEYWQHKQVQHWRKIELLHKETGLRAWSDTIWPVQSQEKARSLEFWILEEEGMNYP